MIQCIDQTVIFCKIFCVFWVASDAVVSTIIPSVVANSLQMSSDSEELVSVLEQPTLHTINPSTQVITAPPHLYYGAKMVTFQRKKVCSVSY